MYQLPFRRHHTELLCDDAILRHAGRLLGTNTLSRNGVIALQQMLSGSNVLGYDISTFSADGLLLDADDLDRLIRPGGREIRLLLPVRQDHNTVAGLLERYLRELGDVDNWPEGVEVREYPSVTSGDSRGVLHAKIVTARCEEGLVHMYGSANLTRNAMHYNVETLTISVHDEPGRLQELFERAWEGGSPITVDEAHHRVTQAFIEGRPVEQCFDYQEQAISEAIERLEQQLERYAAEDWEPDGVILRLPTGAGKTMVAVEVLLRYALDRYTVIWISHMHELLAQAELTLERQCRANSTQRAHITPIMLDGETDDFDIAEIERHELVFCTDARLYNLLEKLEGGLERTSPILIVVDEAHRCHRNSDRYRHILDVLRPEALLGLTATPTFERPAFQEYWNAITVPTLDDYTEFEEWLVDEEFLARVHGERIEAGVQFEIANVPENPELYLTRRVSDFADEELSEKIVETYMRECPDEKALVFAVSIDHAEEIIALFEDQGIRARAFHSGNDEHEGLSRRERREILQSFRYVDDDSIQVLVSVMLAAQGVDLPKIENLFLARPTFSSVLYGQMLGRGRRGPKMGGTKTCRVFDFTWSFIDDQGNPLPLHQRTWDTLDQPGDSEQHLRAAIYIGGGAVERECSYCKERFDVAKKPNDMPFDAVSDWLAGDLRAAPIHDWPAHILLIRSNGEPFRCCDVDSAAEELRAAVEDGRTARAWAGGRARVYYLPLADE